MEQQAPRLPDAAATRGSALLTRLRRDTAFLLPSFPLALAGFISVVVLLSAGVGLLIVWVGLPILVAALGAARGFATLERVRLNQLDGTPIPHAGYGRAPADAGRIGTLLWPLRQPQYWLDALWSVVGLVTATLAWSISVTWYAAVLGGLTYWLWQGALPPNDGSLADLLGLGEGRLPETLLNTGFGVFALLTLPWVLRAATWIHAEPARLLLNRQAALHDEVDAERRSRQAHQDAEARALRRFERDIHDGPQQRLVRLSMDLGRAKKQLDTDPAHAAETIDAALRQARETVDELRSLTRGIAPPLLVDRGLKVALDELVDRAGVPVSLDYAVATPLPPATETAIYFTVSEALTNVAKHSLAHHAAVRVAESDGIRVDVTISDDGLGGAGEAKGTGLRGLRSRIEGVGGLLTIDSPDGGPTVVFATVPLP